MNTDEMLAKIYSTRKSAQVAATVANGKASGQNFFTVCENDPYYIRVVNVDGVINCNVCLGHHTSRAGA